ncbi:hypothetical protein K435DRAFT_872782 [Dendrothele bispora CBS 962.96]|uniref:ABM domain-containing protein n=1 Tax=Dendrothele bispora (strain CBS 962.96) TaxID=1314807 RepID=A0A4S8L0Q1_DENBC|nr:hypothetical protein K435DRAFT_872782 [Dendrothele bispora CBS 962.96]
MNPITLELLKFTVSKGFDLTASPAFASLRQTVAKYGVKEQHYGLNDDDHDQLLWVIQWPEKKDSAEVKPDLDNAEFRQKVNALDVNSKPESYRIPFRFAEEVKSALNAPLSEFAFVVVQESTKIDSIIISLHRAFSDCYYAKGFAGGSWGIASNNDRVCLYVIGWESRAHHTEFTKGPISAVEIDNLTPHFAPGSVGLFSKLTKEPSS